MSLAISQKFFYSFLSALLFVAVSHPITYSFVNSKIDGILQIGSDCPTALGHITHTAAFFILTLIMMIVVGLFMKSEQRKSLLLMAKYSLYATLIFYFVSNGELYQIANKLMGTSIADSTGCPTNWGILLHSGFYLLLIFTVMFFPKDIPYVKVDSSLFNKL